MRKKKEQEAKEAKREILLTIADADGTLEVGLTTKTRKLLRALHMAAKTNGSLFTIFYVIVASHIARADNPAEAVSDFLRHVDKAVELIKGEDTLQDPEGILTHDS